MDSLISLTRTGPFFLLGALAVVPARAFADGPKTSAKAAAQSEHALALYVEGGKTEGTKAEDIRDEIAAGLPETVRLVDPKDLTEALGRAGQKLPIGATLSAFPAQRKTILGHFGKAAADAGAEAVIIAIVKPKKGGGQEVRLFYVKAGEPDADIETAAPLDPSFGKAAKTALDPDISTLGTSKKPDTDTPKDAPKKTEDKPKDDDSDSTVLAQAKRPANTHGREILDAFVALDLGGRFFNYHDGLSKNLRSYSVFPAPGIAVAVGVYPMATLKLPILQNLGIVGDFRIQPGISSKTSDGTKVATAWNRFDGGLRYRQPLAKQSEKGDKAVVLGVTGSAGRDEFLLHATGTLGMEAPSVNYVFLRAGLDASFPAGPILLVAKAGYLGSLSSGSVYERFRNSKIGGIDLGGGVTVPIALGFEARLTAEYIRWFYAFAPLPGDPYVAGGALDQYVHLELGPAYVF